MWSQEYTVQFAPLSESHSETQWVVQAQDGETVRSCRTTLGSRRIEKAYQRVLPVHSRDLLDIALAVYASDRICPRRPTGVKDEYGMRWARRIAVQLPLRDPIHWHSGSRLTSLCSLLEYLTGDRWYFEFTPRPLAKDDKPRQECLFRWPPSDLVEIAPFSGGMDSLAGAVNYLESTPVQIFSLIVGGTGTQMKHRQTELLKALQEHFPSRVLPIRVPYGLWHRNYSANDDEASQRSRGFVHLMLVAVAALLLEKPGVNVFENGIGALGLPYNRGQLGTHISRAVQPQTLARMKVFIKDVFDYSLHFHNPFMFETKGMMCKRLTADWLRKPIARSVSCDEFPQRVPDHAQCGICPSCILRRVSLRHAGLVDADVLSRYRFDVTDPTRPLDQQRLYKLYVMLDQVDRFRTCLRGSAWEELTVAFPDLMDAADVLVDEEELSEEHLASALTALIRAYVLEWDAFPYHLPAHDLKLCS